DALVDLARQNMQRRQLVLLYTSMVGEAVTAEHPAHDWMRNHYDCALDVLLRDLRNGQRSGHVRADAPAETIARSVVALMDGLQVQWLLEPEFDMAAALATHVRSEEHTSELQSRFDLVCRLLLEKK